jgi:hypothetical protein
VVTFRQVVSRSPKKQASKRPLEGASFGRFHPKARSLTFTTAAIEADFLFQSVLFFLAMAWVSQSTTDPPMINDRAPTKNECLVLVTMFGTMVVKLYGRP